MSDANIKQYSAEIFRIATALWPDEFNGIYSGSMENYRDFMNGKTGLNEDHIPYDQREEALKSWLDVLQTIEAGS